MLDEEKLKRVRSLSFEPQYGDAEDIRWLIGLVFDLDEEIDELKLEVDQLKGEA